MVIGVETGKWPYMAIVREIFGFKDEVKSKNYMDKQINPLIALNIQPENKNSSKSASHWCLCQCQEVSE